MSGGFTFDENDDEGIFANDPSAAAGDPDARIDMEAQHWVPGLTLGMDEDGLVVMPEMEGEEEFFAPPEPVDIENFICLGGPCKHYTENARLVPEGPTAGAEENVEIGRWCGKIRTWAEQTDLTELKILACTGHEPAIYGSPSQVRKANEQNARVLAEVRQQIIDQRLFVGVCAIGPCESFVEMIAQKPKQDQAESLRWCTRLGGLGRLYGIREKPVVACSGWHPVGKDPRIGAVAVQNLKKLAEYRKKMAERKTHNDDGPVDLSLLDKPMNGGQPPPR